MLLKDLISNDWRLALSAEFGKGYFLELEERLNVEWEGHDVFPVKGDIFTAYNLCSLADTKVVIIGQDPYHGVGQAHGLAFSVLDGVKIPPSLRNIYKELESDVGCRVASHGNLSNWAKQGCLLINAVLTVRAHEPNSHVGWGWERFVDATIDLLNRKDTPVVFVLWGANAQKREVLIDSERHHIIKSAHPSPLSARRGFFASRPFSRINKLLELGGLEPIDWRLPERQGSFSFF